MPGARALLASGAEIRYLNSFAEDDFVLDLAAQPEDVLARTTIVYLCSPTNPQGGVMSLEQIKSALNLARKYEFLLVMDECYCDIWRSAPPAGALAAAASLHEAEGRPADKDPLRNLLVLNSPVQEIKCGRSACRLYYWRCQRHTPVWQIDRECWIAGSNTTADGGG